VFHNSVSFSSFSRSFSARPLSYWSFSLFNPKSVLWFHKNHHLENEACNLNAHKYHGNKFRITCVVRGVRASE